MIILGWFLFYFFQITEAGKGKLPNPERVKKLILGILQSTAFLSYNGFGFVWGHCFVRWARVLTNESHFFSLGFCLGSPTSGPWPSCPGGCAVSSPSWWREGVGEQLWLLMLPMWLGYADQNHGEQILADFQASESVFNSLHKKGLIPKLKHGNGSLLIFISFVNSFLDYSGYPSFQHIHINSTVHIQECFNNQWCNIHCF